MAEILFFRKRKRFSRLPKRNRYTMLLDEMKKGMYVRKYLGGRTFFKKMKAVHCLQQVFFFLFARFLRGSFLVFMSSAFDVEAFRQSLKQIRSHATTSPCVNPNSFLFLYDLGQRCTIQQHVKISIHFQKIEIFSIVFDVKFTINRIIAFAWRCSKQNAADYIQINI